MPHVCWVGFLLFHAIMYIHRKGVFFNFTFTRMAYTTYRVAQPTEDETAISAGKANTDCKLMEALIESVPQLFIQLTALFSGVIPRVNDNGYLRWGFIVACISVTISFLSIVSSYDCSLQTATAAQ